MKRTAFSAAALLLAAVFTAAVGPAEEPMLPYTPSLDVTAMDRTVDPCVDFYQYTCGGWQRNNPIPRDQTAWNVYRKLSEENVAFLRGILEQAAAAKHRDAVTQKIGDYYAACLDEAAADRLGAAPLKAELDAIAAVASVKDLAPFLARLQRESTGRGILFTAGSQQDPDDSEAEIASFDQGGPRPARSGLLHQRGRQDAGQPREVSRAHCQDARTPRRPSGGGQAERRRDHAPRDRAGCNLANQGRAPRPVQDEA